MAKDVKALLKKRCQKLCEAFSVDQDYVDALMDYDTVDLLKGALTDVKEDGQKAVLIMLLLDKNVAIEVAALSGLDDLNRRKLTAQVLEMVPNKSEIIQQLIDSAKPHGKIGVLSVLAENSQNLSNKDMLARLDALQKVDVGESPKKDALIKDYTLRLLAEHKKNPEMKLDLPMVLKSADLLKGEDKQAIYGAIGKSLSVSDFKSIFEGSMDDEIKSVILSDILRVSIKQGKLNTIAPDLVLGAIASNLVDANVAIDILNKEYRNLKNLSEEQMIASLKVLTRENAADNRMILPPDLKNRLVEDYTLELLKRHHDNPKAGFDFDVVFESLYVPGIKVAKIYDAFGKNLRADDFKKVMDANLSYNDKYYVISDMIETHMKEKRLGDINPHEIDLAIKQGFISTELAIKVGTLEGVLRNGPENEDVKKDIISGMIVASMKDKSFSKLDPKLVLKALDKGLIDPNVSSVMLKEYAKIMSTPENIEKLVVTANKATTIGAVEAISGLGQVFKVLKGSDFNNALVNLSKVSYTGLNAEGVKAVYSLMPQDKLLRAMGDKSFIKAFDMDGLADGIASRSDKDVLAAKLIEQLDKNKMYDDMMELAERQEFKDAVISRIGKGEMSLEGFEALLFNDKIPDNVELPLSKDGFTKQGEKYNHAVHVKQNINETDLQKLADAHVSPSDIKHYNKVMHIEEPKAVEKPKEVKKPNVVIPNEEATVAAQVMAVELMEATGATGDVGDTAAKVAADSVAKLSIISRIMTKISKMFSREKNMFKWDEIEYVFVDDEKAVKHNLNAQPEAGAPIQSPEVPSREGRPPLSEPGAVPGMRNIVNGVELPLPVLDDLPPPVLDDLPPPVLDDLPPPVLDDLPPPVLGDLPPPVFDVSNMPPPDAAPKPEVKPSDLLEARKNAKPVDVEAEIEHSRVEAEKRADAKNPKAGLLGQIKGGAKLRKVDQAELERQKADRLKEFGDGKGDEKVDVIAEALKGKFAGINPDAKVDKKAIKEEYEEKEPIELLNEYKHLLKENHRMDAKSKVIAQVTREAKALNVMLEESNARLEVITEVMKDKDVDFSAADVKFGQWKVNLPQKAEKFEKASDQEKVDILQARLDKVKGKQNKALLDSGFDNADQARDKRWVQKVERTGKELDTYEQKVEAAKKEAAKDGGKGGRGE